MCVHVAAMPLPVRRWAAVPEDEWPAEEAQRGVIMSDFEDRWGDRRQEIVFIGVAMDEVGCAGGAAMLALGAALHLGSVLLLAQLFAAEW